MISLVYLHFEKQNQLFIWELNLHKIPRITVMHTHYFKHFLFLILTPFIIEAKSSFPNTNLYEKNNIALNSTATVNGFHLSLIDLYDLSLNEDPIKDSVNVEKPKSEKVKNTSVAVEATKKTVPSIVTYKIYADGRIEKHIPKTVKKGFENKYKYLYFDKEGKKHNLGEFTVYKTQKYRDTIGKFINLICLEEVPKYYKKGNYQYHFNIDSPRSYVNEKTLASFFGALLEVGFMDIGCNGFSHKDGSSRPSKSHINGNNGDFKYLRIDKSLNCGRGTSLNIIRSPNSFDYERQNKWNDALYKFGWKSMLGWSYKVKGKTKYLNHIPHNSANHYHHLHVQHYKPDFKEIKE